MRLAVAMESAMTFHISKRASHEGESWLKEVILFSGLDDNWQKGDKFLFRNFPYKMGGASVQYSDDHVAMTIVLPKEIKVDVKGAKTSEVIEDGETYIKYVKKAPLGKHSRLLEDFYPAVQAFYSNLESYSDKWFGK